jgi:hypothetical protein
MTKEELKQEAEKFIIDRYKLNECYREDNAETREYMRMDVHSQYEEEYQLYLDATKELREENAELKEMNEGYCRNRDRLIAIGFPNFKDCKEYADQLTKAKVALRNVIDYLGQFCSDYPDCVIKAEQFLKDCEVEK